MLKNPELNKVGVVNKQGKSMYVQIDETFCGKVKHHKGRSKKQTWVLGGVEMPDDTDPPQEAPKCFAMTVPDRKRATLIPILEYKIEENTIIWSDGWSSYFCLRSHFNGWD